MVTELVNKNYDSGHYEVNFNASGLCSGVYFFRMEAGEFVQTNKMILIR
jgi:hypothetical protein